MAFIRLKRRTGKRDVSLYAVLVESERVDGKPRQRVIKHLASIKTNKKNYPGYRFKFWEGIEDSLAELGYSPDEIDDLAMKISEAIPRPTQAELKQWKQERDQWRQTTRMILGRSAQKVRTV